MAENPVPHFLRQVDAGAVLLQDIHHSEALLIVPEASGRNAVERALTGMAEWRMAQVVTQSDGLHKVLIEAQCLRDRPGILGYFQRMCHARPVVVAVRGQEHLCLVLEPPERFAVQDPVPVPLKDRAYVALFLGDHSPEGLRRKRCPWRKKFFFS